MTIKILNNDIELQAFPSSQSIILESDVLFEENTLDEYVVLFRLQKEKSLVKLAEPYSYNLGFIKETFDSVPLSYSITEVDGKYQIVCQPTKLLNLDSTYCLYVDKNISNKQINVLKNNSKSKSNIQVNIRSKINLMHSHNLKIINTSQIINNKNITAINFNGNISSKDLRIDNKIIYNELEIVLEDTVYVKDEEFVITVSPNVTSLDENLICEIHTVNSSTITPIPVEQISTKVSNADILSFYQTLNNPDTKNINTLVIPEYLDTNVFTITIPEGYVVDTSTDFKYKLSLAFNNYLLNSLNKYDKTKKYICFVTLDDFDNKLIFELFYSEDEEQTDLVVFDLGGLL